MSNSKRKMVGVLCIAMLLASNVLNSKLYAAPAMDVDGMGDTSIEEVNKKKKGKQKKTKKQKKQEHTFPAVYKLETDAKDDVFQVTDKVLLKNPSSLGINLKGALRRKEQSFFNIYNSSGAMEPCVYIKYLFIDIAKDCTETILKRKDAFGLAGADAKKGFVRILKGELDNAIIRHYTKQNDRYVMVNKTRVKDYKLRSFYGEDVDEFVELEKAGPKPKNNDIFQVEVITTVLPREHIKDVESREKMLKAEANGKKSNYWMFLLNACRPFSRWTQDWEKAFSLDMKEKAPANNSTASARLDISGKGKYPHLLITKLAPLPIEKMILDVWMKQKGLKSGTVQVSIGNSGKNQFEYSQEVKVTTQWKKYSLYFDITKSIHGNNNFLNIGTSEKGTLWIDNCAFYRKKFKPYSIIPEGGKLIKYMQPGVIRHWAGFSWGNNTDISATNFFLKDASNAPYNLSKMNLKMCLELCKLGNSNPWINLDAFAIEEDLNNILEYLCAPKDVGYGKVRAEQGHPEPWINEFRNIYFECDNEQWGFVNGNTEQYVPMFNRWADILRANKYYKDGYFKLIANGWTLFPVGVKNPKLDKNGKAEWHSAYWGRDVVKRTQCDIIDFAGYMRGFDGLHSPGEEGYDTVQKEGLMRAEFYHLQKYQEALDLRDEILKTDKNRRPYKIAVYEGGPGSSTVDRKGMAEGCQSLATGISVLNLFMKGQRDKELLEFGQYHHGFGSGWSTYSKKTKKPLIYTQLMRLRSVYCQGDMLQVDTKQCKTVTVPKHKSPYNKANPKQKPNIRMTVINETKGIPFSNCFAFKKDKTYSVMVYNLSYDEPRKVTLNLPYKPSSNAKIYFITGKPTDNNIDSEKIKIQEKSISDFKNGYSFTIAPCSVYVIVNEAK